MLKLKNCIICGQVFTGASDICNNCKVAEEKAFQKVYKYLRDYPRATLNEVATVTEVSEELISKFVKDGRILASNISVFTKCIACGGTIDKGHYCGSCLSKLRNAASDVKQVLERKIDNSKQHEGPLISRLLD